MRVYSFNRAMQKGIDTYSTVSLVDLETKKYLQDEESEFFRNIHQSYPWNEPFAPYWKSPIYSLITFFGYPFADIGKGSSINIDLISQESKTLIGEHIIRDGEFLKLELSGTLFESAQTKKGYENRILQASSIKHPIPTGYYWFRITRYVEGALRLEDAMGFTHDPEWVSYLEKYDFHPEKLEGIYLFNISKPTHPGTFATGEFVDLVRKHDLKGLEFQLIWDSENPDYVDERFKPEIWAEIKARHAKRN
jgi:hypothetical protein